MYLDGVVSADTGNRPRRDGAANHRRPENRCLPIWWLAVLLVADARAADGFRLWGELGYAYRYEKSSEMGDLSEHIPILRVDASTYLFRPWIATLTGGMQLRANRSTTRGSKSDSDNVIGDASLRLFPMSYFPLELYVERTDTQTDTDLSDLAIDRTRYGFYQRYLTEGGSNFRLRYERQKLVNEAENIADGASERTDVSDFVEAAFQRNLNFHNLSVQSHFNHIDTLDSPRETKTSFTTLRHSYRPGARLTADDILTYITEDLTTENRDTSIDTFQMTSYAFWRPDLNQPLRINASLRAILRDSASDGGPSVRSQGAITSAFANYQLNDRWLLTGGLGGGIVDDIDGSPLKSDFESFRASYSSRVGNLLGLDASWTAVGDVRREVDADQKRYLAGGLLGYNLGRSWDALGGSLRAELRQRVEQLYDTQDLNAIRLHSEASLMWSLQRASRSTLARIGFNDTRTDAQNTDVRGVSGDFQIVNAQLSVNQRFAPNTSLSGSVSLQAIRNYRPGMEFSGDTRNGEWNPTATADMTFFQRRLFSVSGLSFRSTVRFISDAYVPLLDPETERGRNNKYWDNRLEYFVGRMELRLTARLSKIRSDERLLTLFQVRRLIGNH